MNKPSSSDLVFQSTRAQRLNIKSVLEKGPRSSKGDPQFTSLEQLAQFLNEEDVLYLVNKALYQLDYQSSFHKKRNEEMRLLRQQAKERQTQLNLKEGIANGLANGETPSTPTQLSTPTVSQPQQHSKPSAVADTKSLTKALSALRKEVDSDLGPSGVPAELEFTEEAVPPTLTEDEERRLEGAFAKKPLS